MNNLYIKQVLEHLETEDRVNFYTALGMPYIIEKCEDGYEVFDVMLKHFNYYKESEIEFELNKLYEDIEDEELNGNILPEYYQHREMPCLQLQESFSYKDTKDIPSIVGYYENIILKYLYRYRMKNGIEDLKKARTFINFLISLMSTPDNREDKDE